MALKSPIEPMAICSRQWVAIKTLFLKVEMFRIEISLSNHLRPSRWGACGLVPQGLPNGEAQRPQMTHKQCETAILLWEKAGKPGIAQLRQGEIAQITQH